MYLKICRNVVTHTRLLLTPKQLSNPPCLALRKTHDRYKIVRFLWSNSMILFASPMRQIVAFFRVP